MTPTGPNHDGIRFNATAWVLAFASLALLGWFVAAWPGQPAQLGQVVKTAIAVASVLALLVLLARRLKR